MNHERKIYLDYMARCQQAFRPFAPIELPDFFKGRHEHVQMLVSELATPGRQVAVYGERGVGKTSLAKLADSFANYSDEHTHFVRCQQASTYESIFGQLLRKAGKEYFPTSVEVEAASGGAVSAGPASISRSKRARSTQQAIESSRTIGPTVLLEVFKDRDGLLVIDEYDRVQDVQTHTRLAETLKHFSDAASATKLIVVGVAETLADLVGEHQSLTRCLAQIKLDRMGRDELAEIVNEGEERLGAVLKEDVRQKIIGLSDGFPFYTHLLCLYCAEHAGKVLIKNPKARVVVSETEYRGALRRAINTAEGTLHDDYQAAVISVKRKTEMFKNVLWAVAYSDSREVQVQEIADNIGQLTGARPKTEALGNYLGPLVKPEKREVLVRVRQGYYKFANPLMRAYVRLILEEHNIVEQNGQMQFPWMRNFDT